MFYESNISIDQFILSGLKKTVAVFCLPDLLNGATLKGPFSAVSKKDDFSAAVVSRSQPEEICLLVYSQLSFVHFLREKKPIKSQTSRTAAARSALFPAAVPFARLRMR